MSRDFWRAVTVVTRNVALTWAVLLPILALPVLLAQALFISTYYSTSEAQFFTGGDLLQRAYRAAELPIAFLAGFGLLSVTWLFLQRGAQLWQRLVALVSLAVIGIFVYQVMPSRPASPAPFIGIAVLMTLALASGCPSRRFSGRAT